VLETLGVGSSELGGVVSALGVAVGAAVGDVIGDVDGVGSSTQKTVLILPPKSLPDKISVSPSTTLKDPVPCSQQIPSPYESVMLKT